jgi:hypothetical protein
MRVVLTNNSKNITVTFQDHSEFIRDHDYILYDRCYAESVNNDLTFKAVNWVGFLGNNIANPYAERGSQEDGINFYSNWFSERTISWEFSNVFINLNNGIASPNNILNSLLMEKNDIIRVDVYTSKWYYQDFYVTENTNTEVGVIELKGAYGNEIFWNSDNVDQTYFFDFYGSKRKYITKNLPQVLLTKEDYPLLKKYFTNQKTSTSIQAGGNNTGTWDSLEITNLTNGDNMKITNNFNDRYLNVDEVGTATNQNGEIRSGCVTGSIHLENGINDIIFKINDQEDYIVAQENLPLDFNFSFSYTGKYSGVE